MPALGVHARAGCNTRLGATHTCRTCCCLVALATHATATLLLLRSLHRTREERLPAHLPAMPAQPLPYAHTGGLHALICESLRMLHRHKIPLPNMAARRSKGLERPKTLQALRRAAAPPASTARSGNPALPFRLTCLIDSHLNPPTALVSALQFVSCSCDDYSSSPPSPSSIRLTPGCASPAGLPSQPAALPRCFWPAAAAVGDPALAASAAGVVGRSCSRTLPSPQLRGARRRRTGPENVCRDRQGKEGSNACVGWCAAGV